MKKHFLTFILAGILGISASDAQKYKYDWMKMITFDKEMVSLQNMKMYADDNGNIYTVFHFQWDIHMGRPPKKKKDPEPPVLSAGEAYQAAYIEKRNCSGDVAWTKVIRLGDTNLEDNLSLLFNWNNDLSIARNGDIYLTGIFDKKADFGDGITLNSVGRNDMYIAKINSEGKTQWAIRAGGSGSNYGEADAGGIAVAATQDGGVYATGVLNAYPKGGGTYGDGQPLDLTEHGGTMCLFKISSEGKVDWLKKAPPGTFLPTPDMSVDVYDNIYIPGSAQFAAQWGDHKTDVNGLRDAVIFKLDKDGNHIWTKVWGWGKGGFDGKTMDNEGVNLLSVSPTGEISTMVTLYNGAKIGDLKIKTSKDHVGDLETLLVNLDTDGNVIRTAQFEGAYGQVPNGIMPGLAGNAGNLFFNVGKKVTVGKEKTKDRSVYSYNAEGDLTFIMTQAIPELKGVYGFGSVGYTFCGGKLYAVGPVGLVSDVISQFAGSSAGKRYQKMVDKNYIYDRDFEQGIVMVQFSN